MGVVDETCRWLRESDGVEMCRTYSSALVWWLQRFKDDGRPRVRANVSLTFAVDCLTCDFLLVVVFVCFLSSFRVHIGEDFECEEEVVLSRFGSRTLGVICGLLDDCGGKLPERAKEKARN